MKRVYIEYNLMAASGLLVGSTAEALSIGLDKSTIRRRRVDEKTGSPLKQEPAIPGSTIKGKVRNECERILASLGWPVCRAPRAETMCPHDPNVTSAPCAVCQIFGSPDRQSRLFFNDASTSFKDANAAARLRPYLTRVQTGVSLARQRRTAEDERLYFVERGVEGLTYAGQIEGYLDDDAAARQLALVIAALQNLVAVGGSKSRGAGWTRAEVVKVMIGTDEFTAEQISEMRAKGLEQWRKSS